MSADLETQSSSSPEPESSQNSKSTGNINLRCPHWLVKDRSCFRCKKQINRNFCFAFGYLAKGVRFTIGLVGAMGFFNSGSCSRREKLHLVLDLDHTLLHTKSIESLRGKEIDLIAQAGSRTDLRRVRISHFGEYLVKIRPFVVEFLRRANELFKLYVFTMGSPEYAEVAVSLLDPQGTYFRRRVITRADYCGYSKTLDLVLAPKNGVVVVDDTPEVWPADRRNLITVPKYVYFREFGLRSCFDEGTDEGELDGPLAAVLNRLEKIHEEFFKDQTDSRDVRLLI